ncbi:MAG: ubiquitin [Clostridium sp.]|nr:ubiquitin [Clostridium sp.]
MDNPELIKKLSNKANINVEDAKKVLEENDWDILESILCLENRGVIEKPSVSVFYTNEPITNEKNYNLPVKIYNSKKRTHGLFEFICNVIDSCNNIFLEIKRGERIYVKVPLTAVLILLFFSFGFMVPAIIIASFFEVEFYLESDNIDTTKINVILKKLFLLVKVIREKLKKGDK